MKFPNWEEQFTALSEDLICIELWRVLRSEDCCTKVHFLSRQCRYVKCVTVLPLLLWYTSSIYSSTLSRCASDACFTFCVLRGAISLIFCLSARALFFATLIGRDLDVSVELRCFVESFCDCGRGREDNRAFRKAVQKRPRWMSKWKEFCSVATVCFLKSLLYCGISDLCNRSAVSCRSNGPRYWIFNSVLDNVRPQHCTGGLISGLDNLVQIFSCSFVLWKRLHAPIFINFIVCIPVCNNSYQKSINFSRCSIYWPMSVVRIIFK